ncbi:MAG: Phosphoesterase, PA-phosphatase related protein [Planctomycetaceae bacterium]|nr:Phosphoesterase, PA-phosphatase related protein [Planctomycetaceae bacterium]
MKLFPFRLHGTSGSRRKSSARRYDNAVGDYWAAMVERLENRVFLASNITASLSKGILTITGSADADRVTVQPAGQPGSVRISVAGGTVNSQQFVELQGLTKDLRAFLAGGNDQIVIQGFTGANALPKNLIVDTGDGADVVDIHNVKVNGTTKLTLDAGSDLLQIDDAQFVKKATLDSGDGDDGILLDRRTDFSGTTQFNNKLAVSLGAGTDVLRLGIDGDSSRRVSVAKPMTVDGGTETDAVAISTQSQAAAKFKAVEFHVAATLPLVTAQLANDTGPNNNDQVTSDPSIAGNVTGFAPGSKLIGGYDAASLVNFVDLSSFVQVNGSFTLSQSALESRFPGVLTDGEHTLHLQVADKFGESSALFNLSFTLVTSVVVTPTLSLSPTSDTGTVGDSETSVARVTLVGETTPQASVTLVDTGDTTVANTAGVFQFTNVALAVGENSFTVSATNGLGNPVQQSATFTRLNQASSSDVVLDWNGQTLAAIQRDGSDPLIASRILAMESLAAYDLVSAFDGVPGFYVSLAAPAGASLAAAVAGAAERILSHEYPTQQGIVSDQLAISLASIPEGQSKADGLQFGRAIADAILSMRDQDGSRDFLTYIPGSDPGQWQPTAPMFLPAVQANWPNVAPFIISNPDDYLPDGPPALTSSQWAADFNQVKAIGAADSATRTADQTQIARFWVDGQGTFTPPGHWNEIAKRVAVDAGNSLSANARMLAMLNLAMMDAGVVAWNAKYTFEFWRPITSIPAADSDGNAATAPDADWQPLLGTPAFPEYVSGHSAFSGAASEVLTNLFGDNVAFSSTSIGLPNVTRSYTSFEQAASEAGMSRVYGGIHYLTSNLDGLAAGHAVGETVIDAFSGHDAQPPQIIVDDYSAVDNQSLTLTGHVIDAVAGVSKLIARIDGAAPVTVTFNAGTGAFSIPLNLATTGADEGVHHVLFVAQDAIGNATDPLDVAFTLDTVAPTFAITSPVVSGQLADGSRLTGTANPTGSKIVALSYAFDSDPAMPIGFNPQTGAFDVSLEIGKLSVGSHVLHVATTDAAGNSASTNINVTLNSAVPLKIVDMTPKHDASDVGVTFHPKFTFSRPVDVTTLTAANFHASVSGQNLPITVVPGDDGTYAWIFFSSPMPGGATIEIAVDGSAIHAADGTPLDADSDGTPGGTLHTSFRTVSTTGVPGTTIAGIIVDPGADLIPHDFDDVRAGPDGALNTDDDVYLHPLAGVKVFVLGQEDQAVFTDANGKFLLDPVPTGDVKLVIQGGFATNAPTGVYFPEMVMDVNSIPGTENWAMEDMKEFYLPRIPTVVLHPISNNVPTTIGLESAAGLNLTAEQVAVVSMTAYPNTAIGFDGQVMSNAQFGISVVPSDFVRMMLPNGVTDLPFSFTVQAPGVAQFTIPVSLTVPNFVGAAPGAKLPFISFDHATGLMSVEGTMTVSADGLSISSDPGSGITHPGWHFYAPPPPPPPPPPPDPDDPCVANTNSIPPTQKGNDEYVVMRFPNIQPNPLVVRLRSDDGGHFEAIVPGNQQYKLTIYDPGSGLVATGTGKTAPPGERFDPTTGLSLHVSTAPDTDGDGLPDDAEFAIGSDVDKTDTDSDGISDFAEVKQNLDPLSNRPLKVGLTASLALNGTAEEIVVAGSPLSPATLTGFVATGSYGLAIVDLSEFKRPITLSELDLPGDATDVDADLTAKIAVVAANAGGLHFVNISDPVHPVLIRTLNVNASAVEISDGTVYVAVGGQLRSYDELTGDFLQTVVPGGGAITGLTRQGTWLYTMDSGNVLRVIDTAGLVMTLRGSLTLPQGGGKVFVDNGVAYAVARDLPQGGFVTVNVANPNSLLLISGVDNGQFGLANNALVTNGSGLALLAGETLTQPRSEEIALLNVSDPSNTFAFLNRIVLPSMPESLTIASGIAFVADGEGDLQVVTYRAFDALGQPPTVAISSNVTDVAPGTPGTQVVEGSSVPIHVVASDDVQVRNVELLVNGVVQANDVQAPFDFFAIMPAIAAAGTQAIVQVRATDTGGNSTLSNALTFGLLPDVVPPTLISTTPSNNDVAFDTNAISLRFSEAINPSLLNLSGVTLTNLGNDGVLGGGDDSIVPLASIQAASANRVIVLPQAPLPKGKFQLVVNKSILADVPGNQATVNATLTFTNYVNLAPTTVVWNSDSNGAWDNPANWSTGVVPGPNDDVLIDRIGANPTVTHSTGNHTVQSLQTAEPLTISGGTLTINGGTTSLIQGTLTVTGSGSLVATGASTIINATGATNLNGGTVVATNGGILNLSGVTSYTGASFNTFIEADNANSQINLPNLTALTGGSGNAAVFVRAFSGGAVNLPTLAGVTGGSTQFFADAGSITAPLLTSFIDNTPNNGTSQIRIHAGGTIVFGTLTSLNEVDLQLGTGTFAISQFTSITNSSITVEAGKTATFTKVTTATGVNFFANTGGILNLPILSSYSGSSDNTFIEADNANSQVNLPNLTTFTGGLGNAAVFVRGFTGGTVNLPLLPAVSGGTTQFFADAGTINAPLLASFVDDTPNNGRSLIRVHAGGSILFGNLTSLDLIDLQLGVGTLAISQMTSITNSSITVEDGRTATFTNLATTTGMSFFASSGGVLNLPAVTSYAGSDSNTFIESDNASSQINLPNMTTLTGGAGNAAVFVRGFTGGTVNLPLLSAVNGGTTQFYADAGTISAPLLATFVDDTPNNGSSLIRIHAGGTIQLGNLTSLDMVNLQLGLGTLPINQFTAITNASITAEEGQIATFTNLATTSGSSFFADTGGVLNLPAVTTYSGSTSNTFIQVDNANSQINLPNLTSLTGGTSNAALFVRGFSGGTVNLPALQAVNGGTTQVYADAGTISAPLLATFVDDTNNGASLIRVRSGGTISLGNLTSLDQINLQIGIGTLPVNQFTSVTNASITVEDGQVVTFPNLVTTTGASFFASTGGVLNLPAFTSLSGSSFNTFIQANGDNSEVHLPNLTTLHGATSGAAFIRAFDGGLVQLEHLTSIPDGAVQILATDTGSVVVLSLLTTLTDSSGSTSSIEAQSGGNVEIPLLTNLQFVDLTLDGATSSLNTSQITNINTVNVFADHNAIFNLPGVTSYSGTNFNTFLQADNGGTLALPNLTTFHGATSGAVFARAFAGGTLNLQNLPLIPDGAVQFLATGTGSVLDLSSLTTFTDSSGTTSSIEAENGGNVKIPLLTNLQFVDLTLDGATSSMNTSQLANINTVNLLADHNAVLNLPAVTSYSGSNFNTFIQADNGGTLNLPNLTTLHGATAGAVFVRAFAGGTLSFPSLSSIPDGAVQVLATGAAIVNLPLLTTFIDSSGATSSIEAENGGNVKIPLLTNLQFVDLTLDGATSSMNTSQLANINTVNVLADHDAVLNLLAVTAYSGAGFNTFLQADNGGTLALPNLTTLHGATSGAVFIRAFAGATINLTGLQSIPDGATQILATGTGSQVKLSSLNSFTDSSGTTSSIDADNGGQVRLSVGTTVVTNVDVTIDTASSIMGGTLSLGTGGRLFGTGTITGNVTNAGSIFVGDSSGSATGTLSITGNYTQTAAGSLSIQIGGLTPGTLFDRFLVSGSTALNGTLNLTLANGFNPAVGNTFQFFVSSVSLAGQFAVVTGTTIPGTKSFLVGYSANNVTLTVTSP